MFSALYRTGDMHAAGRHQETRPSEHYLFGQLVKLYAYNNFYVQLWVW